MGGDNIMCLIVGVMIGFCIEYLRCNPGDDYFTEYHRPYANPQEAPPKRHPLKCYCCTNEWMSRTPVGEGVNNTTRCPECGSFDVQPQAEFQQ